MPADTHINEICDDALCRIATGDMDALAVIYEKLGRRIFVLALSVLRDSAAAEDIMQDTFVRIAAEAHAYRQGSNATAFILTMTRNLSINLLNRRRRETPCGELTEENAGASPPEPVAFRALEALSLLDDDERQIVTLKLDGGMKHRDIADLLGIGEAACQKRYRRALEKLREYYS